MKLFRSLIFSCVAMVVAAVCMSAPASAVDYSPGVIQIHSVSYDYVAPDVFEAFTVLPASVALPDRSRNTHAVNYVCQNQPNQRFRQSVEAYSHIDPHIKAA